MATPNNAMITPREVLRLYRLILRHSERLVFTDKEFYKREVRKEFKEAVKRKDRDFQIQV